MQKSSEHNLMLYLSIASPCLQLSVAGGPGPTVTSWPHVLLSRPIIREPLLFKDADVEYDLNINTFHTHKPQTAGQGL